MNSTNPWLMSDAYERFTNGEGISRENLRAMEFRLLTFLRARGG